jgi:hypothetical protein
VKVRSWIFTPVFFQVDGWSLALELEEAGKWNHADATRVSMAKAKAKDDD